MSTDYFLACRKCRDKTPCATVGLSGWLNFQQGPSSIAYFVSKHSDHLDQIFVMDEHAEECDAFADADVSECYYSGKKESEL